MVEVRETKWWLKPPILGNSSSWVRRVEETQPIGNERLRFEIVERIYMKKERSDKFGGYFSAQTLYFILNINSEMYYCLILSRACQWL